MKIKRSRKVVATASVIGLMAAGGAYAFWTAGGAGAGSVATDTTQAMTIVQTASTAKLAPGVSVSLLGTITNPNASAVTVPGITATVSLMPGTGCDPAWFTIGGTSTVASEVAGGATANWSGLNITMPVNATVNQDACKGIAVPLVFGVAP